MKIQNALSEVEKFKFYLVFLLETKENTTVEIYFQALAKNKETLVVSTEEKEFFCQFIDAFFRQIIEGENPEAIFPRLLEQAIIFKNKSISFGIEHNFLLTIKLIQKTILKTISEYVSDIQNELELTKIIYSFFQEFEIWLLKSHEPIFFDAQQEEIRRLLKEKNFSESLIENSIDGLIAFDNTFTCTVWNPQIELITGIEKANAIGEKIDRLFVSIAEFGRENLKKTLQGEILRFTAFRFFAREQYLEVFLIPVYSNRKKVTGGLIIVHNITERHHSEEALRELSQSFQHTVEGIALISPEGQFISVNKAAQSLFGYSGSEMKSMCCEELIFEEDKELFANIQEWVIAENSLITEVRGKSKNGMIIFLEITIVAYIDRQSRLKGYHLFFKDISERKKVENRLKRGEALLAESQELAKLGSWELDITTGAINWTDEMYRIFGLKAKEIKITLNTYFSLLSKEAQDAVTFALQKIQQTFRPSHFEHKIYLPGNKVKRVFGHAKPVVNAKGEIVKITGYIQDITEMKEAEKVLKEAYAELKRAEENLVKINTKLESSVKSRTEELSYTNRKLSMKNEELLRINSDLDNFVYTASHDLKSPISNIEGLINMLSEEMRGYNNPEMLNLVEMIQLSINKFKTTIKDLTEITKIQKNINEDVDLIHLPSLIEETKYDIRVLIEQSEAEISTDIEVESIRFSKKNLRSIFYNLLSNALKYRSPERKAVVNIKVSEVDRGVCIIVKDNGLGINLEQKDKIFLMFKRMHTHVEGTGIGLYIVKRIIENSGGKIEVSSNVGQGTEFKVFLKEI